MTSLLIFGAVGDLAGRYLMPALLQLSESGALPSEMRIRGASREALDDQEFRGRVTEKLAQHLPGSDAVARADFVRRLDYRRADATDPAELAGALRDLSPPVAVYLAVPPGLFEPAVRSLAVAGLSSDCRLVLEKPFGYDLASAKELNGLVATVAEEEHVFRVDHFLGMQTVQNVLGLRFANRVFEPVWNSRHVETVDIVWDETLALEGRAGYYDRAGALRDMLQNHLLQLLCLVAMEPPPSMTARAFRDAKVDVLRAVRSLTPDEVHRDSVRGRYTSGRIEGREIADYVREPGVDPDRGTETYAEVTLWVDNPRWAGVPFNVRSGKALAASRAEIAVRFRQPPDVLFGQAHEVRPNVLRLALDVDRVDLEVNLAGGDHPFGFEPVSLSTGLAAQDIPAYGHLLLDVLSGAPTLFIRADEAEEAWRIFDPILSAWQAGAAPLRDYPAGSSGPGTQPP